MALFDAERLGGLDTQAAARWDDGGEQPGQPIALVKMLRNKWPALAPSASP
jgi:hypothetical protein